MLRASRSTLALWLPCSVLLACAFDSAGNGFPEGASIGDDSTSAGGDEGGDDDTRDESSGSDAPMTTTRGDVPDPTTAGDASTTPSDDGDDDGSTGAADGANDDSADDHTTADDDDSTGEPDVDVCPMEVFDVYWVEQGEVEEPMALIDADANDTPKVAISTVAESGSVTLTLEFACPGEYTLWGLVWDYDPGAWGTPDPDSFYFDIGDAETTWRYGCQTAQESSGLSWQRMASLTAQPCDAAYVVLEVFEAGSVELTLRNREAGDGSQVAGIAAVAVSSDPDANPTTLYDPY